MQRNKFSLNFYTNVLNTNLTGLEANKLSWIKAQNFNPDVNNITSSGFYLFNTNTVSNLPTYDADKANIILVFSYDGACALQIYIGFKSTYAVGVYIRGLWAGQWKSWLQLG